MKPWYRRAQEQNSYNLWADKGQYEPPLFNYFRFLDNNQALEFNFDRIVWVKASQIIPLVQEYTSFQQDIGNVQSQENLSIWLQKVKQVLEDDFHQRQKFGTLKSPSKLKQSFHPEMSPQNSVLQESEFNYVEGVDLDNPPLPEGHFLGKIYCPQCLGEHVEQKCSKQKGRRPERSIGLVSGSCSSAQWKRKAKFLDADRRVAKRELEETDTHLHSTTPDSTIQQPEDHEMKDLNSSLNISDNNINPLALLFQQDYSPQTQQETTQQSDVWGIQTTQDNRVQSLSDIFEMKYKRRKYF